MRSMKCHLEERLQAKVSVHTPVFAWLVELCADWLTKFNRGEDGLTPIERLKGRSYRGEVLDFGTKVWHKVPGKTQGGDTRPRWLEGVWLGVRFNTNEHVVGLPDGRVVRARNVAAWPEEKRHFVDDRHALWLPAPRPTL